MKLSETTKTVLSYLFASYVINYFLILHFSEFYPEKEVKAFVFLLSPIMVLMNLMFLLGEGFLWFVKLVSHLF